MQITHSGEPADIDAKSPIHTQLCTMYHNDFQSVPLLYQTTLMLYPDRMLCPTLTSFHTLLKTQPITPQTPIEDIVAHHGSITTIVTKVTTIAIFSPG